MSSAVANRFALPNLLNFGINWELSCSYAPSAFEVAGSATATVQDEVEVAELLAAIAPNIPPAGADREPIESTHPNGAGIYK
jgi:hypothetical protein